MESRWNDLLANNECGWIITLGTEWDVQKLSKKEISHKMVLIWGIMKINFYSKCWGILNILRGSKIISPKHSNMNKNANKQRNFISSYKHCWVCIFTNPSVEW